VYRQTVLNMDKGLEHQAVSLWSYRQRFQKAGAREQEDSSAAKL
jgi:hypothetical protein